MIRTHDEDLTTPNLYVPNNRASKFLKHKNF